MNRNVKIKLGAAVLMLALFSCVGLAIAMKYRRRPAPGKNAIRKKEVFDPVVLEKLNELVRSMDLTGTCAYKAKISIALVTDSAAGVKNVPVIFCRDGERCYYRYGPEEMLNGEGINLVISNEQKKVMIGKQKQVNATATGSFQEFARGMASEHFELSSDTSGDAGIITLKNERHLTCKEFSITFDKATGKVDRIFARLPDSADPLDKNKEKTITMQIAEWSHIVNWDAYPGIDEVVRISGNKVSLTKKYAGYELINISK